MGVSLPSVFRSVFRPLALALATTCATAGVIGAAGASAWAGPAKIKAVGAENEYADIISQVGGRYVTAGAVMDNPNTDPHEFEANVQVAEEVAGAGLIVQNGAGYDPFMGKLEQASHSPERQVVVVQQVLGLHAGPWNPHLWYRVGSMPAVAAAIASALSRLQPFHRAYFAANARRFDQEVSRVTRSIANFRRAHGRVRVAVTEPVADYLLQAAGARVMTPRSLQLDVMNGVDPSPQDIARQQRLLERSQVNVFLYNQQVTDSLTGRFLSLARAHRIPVVGVYETMPAGYHYQIWMAAELSALARAVTSRRSTTKL